MSFSDSFLYQVNYILSPDKQFLCYDFQESQVNLKRKYEALESSKQEAMNTAREITDRYERLRSRSSELEEDRKEEVRTYRARLEMAEKRCKALENEVDSSSGFLLYTLFSHAIIKNTQFKFQVQNYLKLKI